VRKAATTLPVMNPNLLTSLIAIAREQELRRSVNPR
jgi:hypothetical protein